MSNSLPRPAPRDGGAPAQAGLRDGGGRRGQGRPLAVRAARASARGRVEPGPPGGRAVVSAGSVLAPAPPGSAAAGPAMPAAAAGPAAALAPAAAAAGAADARARWRMVAAASESRIASAISPAATMMPAAVRNA